MLAAIASCGGGTGVSDPADEDGGFVSLFSGRSRDRTSDDQVRVSWGAVFNESNPPCELEGNFYPCILMSCGAEAAASRQPTAPHAGPITVSGTRDPITMVPGADGRYELVERLGAALFTGGETVMISAAGAEAPGFSLTVTAPWPLPVTAPLFSLQASDGAARVPTTRPLAFAWAPVADGRLSVSLAPISPTGTTAPGFLHCGLTTGNARNQIPVAALQAARTRLGSRLRLRASANASAEVVVHAWRISVSVTTEALLPVEGAAESGPEVMIVLE